MTPRRPEPGSVLILVPALVLVMLVLGAISVDASIAYLARRQLDDFTASAADRSAASALDAATFYGAGAVRIDPALAQAVATQAEATTITDGIDITSLAVTVSPDGRAVTVRATATAHTVFGVAVGGRRTFTVSASTTTDVEEVEAGGP